MRSRFPHLTDERVDEVLKDLEATATFVHEVPELFTYARGPDDEPYINLAVAAGARYLVTCDNDLLDLMENEAFRLRFPALTILDPVAFLKTAAAETPGE